MARPAARAPDQTRVGRRVLLQQLAEPLRSFLSTETGSAGLLLIAVLVALAWSNSPLSGAYDSFWTT